MTSELTFVVTPQQSERFRVLDWIYDADTDPPQLTELSPLLAELPHEQRQRLMVLFRSLDSEGLIRLHESMGWEGSSCSIMPEGRQAVEELRQLRGDTLARRKAARDAFLRWLYGVKASGVHAAQLSRFSDSPFSTFYGHAFTDTEVTDAQQWLHDQGLISGQAAWGGQIPRPSITTLGETVAESGQSVNDWAIPTPAKDLGNTTNITIADSPNAQVSHMSPGSIQQIEFGQGSRQKVLAVSEALIQAVPVLGLDDLAAAQAREIAEQLQAVVVERDPDRGVLRQLLDQARTIAVSGTGSAVGNAVVALVEHAITAIG